LIHFYKSESLLISDIFCRRSQANSPHLSRASSRQAEGKVENVAI